MFPLLLLFELDSLGGSFELTTLFILNMGTSSEDTLILKSCEVKISFPTFEILFSPRDRFFVFKLAGSGTMRTLMKFGDVCLLFFRTNWMCWKDYGLI